MSVEAALSKLTARQITELPYIAAELERHGVVTSGFGGSGWHVNFEEESRPGRGHAVNALWCDGEHLVQIGMDVYGSPWISVAEVNWIHGGEDCQCEVCRAEQEGASDGRDA